MGKMADAAEWLETHRFQGLALAGSGFVVVPALFIDWENSPLLSFFLLLLVGVGIFLSVLAPFKERASRDQELATLKERIDEAAGDMHVYYRTIMLPTIEKLHTFLKATGVAKKAGTYESLLGQVLGDAMGFLASDDVRVRVSYYRLNSDAQGLPCLDVVGKTREVRRQRIDTSDAEGRQILLRTLRGKDDYCPDLTLRTGGAMTNQSTRSYASYISVSVCSNGYVYGMLSANTETVGGIQQNAEDYLKVVAGIMAIAENIYDHAKKRAINEHLTSKQLKLRDNGTEPESGVSNGTTNQAD